MQLQLFYKCLQSIQKCDMTEFIQTISCASVDLGMCIKMWNFTILQGPGWSTGKVFDLNLPGQIILAYHLYGLSLHLTLYHTKKGCIWLASHMIRFVSNLLKVGGSFQVLRLPPAVKLTSTIWLKNCWKQH